MLLRPLRTRIHAESIVRGIGEVAISKTVEEPSGIMYI